MQENAPSAHNKSPRTPSSNQGSSLESTMNDAEFSVPDIDNPPPRPVNNLLFDAHQSNVANKVCHEHNNANTNKNTQVIEIDEKLFTDHQPTMNEAEKHKDNFMNSNPQLSIPLHVAAATTFHEFSRWLWKIIMGDMRAFIKFTIM